MEGIVEDIKGVECWVSESILANGEKARMLTPYRVKGQEMREFAASSYAERSQDPEVRPSDLLGTIRVYEAACCETLLNGRPFDIWSLSSPLYQYQLRELSRLANIRPTPSPLRDKIERSLYEAAKAKSAAMPLVRNIRGMLRLGCPPQSKDTKDLLHAAIYQRPKLIPRIDKSNDFDEVMFRELEKLENGRLRVMATGKPWEEVQREYANRVNSFLALQMEQTRFNVLHEGMEKAYRMIQNELSPTEKSLFRGWNLKQPKFLNRIPRLDPSPVWSSFLNILKEIYQRFGTEVAHKILGPQECGELLRAYLHFYRIWLSYIRDDERERSEERTKAEEIEKVVDTYRVERIMPEERTDGPSLDEDGPEDLQYRKGSLAIILAQGGVRYDSGLKDLEKPVRWRWEEKKERPGVIPFELRKKILELEARRASNIEIAEDLGISTSYASKLTKKIRRASEAVYHKAVYRPAFERYYRDVKQLYDGLPAKDKPHFREAYVAGMKEHARRVWRHTHLSQEELEKALIPPCLRN